MEWRPIESAPKDGTKIDLWVVPPPGLISHGAGRLVDCWFFEGGWRTEDHAADEGWDYVVWEATHWKPLPAPPTAE
jgi:hypothetical protein